MTRNDAFERQVQASDPNSTVWLSANAGSGKTRVLTDRVARLLLRGVEPQHILCLTYTKAAASEMQNRLFRRLGTWAMKPDQDLRAALKELGDEGPHTQDALARARQLFARAIEAPGGLRIQTIHSFCAGLLRRFPLEAGVSPQFTEMDDRASRLLRESIVEEMAGFRAPDVIADVALAYTGEDFTALMEQVAANRAGFSPALTERDCALLFGVADVTASAILAGVFLGGEAALIARILPAFRKGGPRDQATAQALSALDLATPSMETLAALEDAFLFGPKTQSPFVAKIGTLPTKPTQKLISDDLPRLDDLMSRVEVARPMRTALLAAQKTATLHRFAATFLPLYEAAKAARGYLDFDDLIARAKALLTNPDVAAWVLFRLDGGIDHILVDEAQDTSPDQWQVIELLAAEFSVGESARSGGRSLFIVGDKKQSIYSFQGADVAAFDKKLHDFKARFLAAGQQFQSLKLEYSFRSSTAILRFVDQTLGNKFPKALGDDVSHLAFKEALPGRVDLWPLVAGSEKLLDENWQDPVDLIAEDHHAARLAEKIAAEIRAMIDSGVQIPVDAEENPAECRPVHEGDFLVLVQRRSALFSEIIRACKQNGLSIAGADRLKLAAELAVKDLAALLAFLDTPEDDLSLAALLRSPLCGWTEAELFTLAYGRKGYLWESLRKSADHDATLSMLTDLRDQVDYLRPFDLIERALTRHDGRRRLLARLGAEAEDGIDEFLSQALAYERSQIPSLTGFLVWLETDDIEVKRQMDGEGHRIRVMTVHGAKGLEAPIVILPDTADRPYQDRSEIFELPDATAVWKTPVDESPALISAIRAARFAQNEEESVRLLYVALTRARVWLIVCGGGTAKAAASWYRTIEQGIKAAGAVAGPDGSLRYEFGAWPPNARHAVAKPTAGVDLAPWTQHYAKTPERAKALVSPSDLGGEKVISADAGAHGAESAKALGSAVHRLLEHLPGSRPEDWPAMAATLLPDMALRDAAFAEAFGVLTAPHLAMVFAPDTLAEVGFTSDLLGRRAVGVIDRLLIRENSVLAVDFKTNAVVPATPGQTPEGLLRQMGAYAEALKQIYPDKVVETAILWTRTATLIPLNRDMVRDALSRSAIP